MTRLYRLLLLAYPRRLRDEHGREMLGAVDEAWRAARARGLGSRLRFTGRILVDFTQSLPGAWRRTDHSPAASAGPGVTTPSSGGRDPMWRTLFRDVRMAARLMLRGRLSTSAIVATLALTIGANAAVFSVVHAVLFKPLPYADPDRLVAVWERNLPRHRDRNVVGTSNFLAWQDRARSFTALAAFAHSTASVTGDDPPEEVPVWYATWNTFDVLGAQAAVGRTFNVDESIPTNSRAVVLGWSLWQRRYHADRTLIGRTILVNGTPRRVVGVMPYDFKLLGASAEIWIPYRFDNTARTPMGRSLRVLGRLAPGVTVGQADAEMDTIAAALERDFPDFNTGWRTSVVPMRDDLVGSVRLPLLFLLAAVGLVLLVGCANTANLLLARAAERRREMAVRFALGASQAQLGRQLLVEGVCLAATGMIAGLALAYLAVAGATGILGAALNVPRLEEAQLSWPVLGFSLGLMGVCALVFSVVPALQVAGARLMPSLLGGGRWSTGAPRERRVRQGLVVVQVALAVVLVVASGLVARSLMRLTAVDPGFDPAQVMTFTVSTPSARYPKPALQVGFLEDAVAGLRQIPGVESASGIAFLPFTGPGIGTSFWRADRPQPPAGQLPVTEVRPIDDEFFRVMRIPVRLGRAFTHDEVLKGAKVAIVNETMVRQMYPGENPIGRPISVNLEDTRPDEIVGVVADIAVDNLQAPIRPMVYYPYGRSPIGFMTFVVRSGLDSAALMRSATTTIQRMDKDLPLTDPKPMRALVDDSVASPSIATLLVSAFAGLALVLSLIGIGALQAASVEARRTEFSIRLALGATPGMIRRLVLSQGARLVIAGLAMGLGAAALLAHLADTLLFEVTPTDPTVYAATAALVVALALLASDVPARRATRVDPVETLRG